MDADDWVPMGLLSIDTHVDWPTVTVKETPDGVEIVVAGGDFESRMMVLEQLGVKLLGDEALAEVANPPSSLIGTTGTVFMAPFPSAVTPAG